MNIEAPIVKTKTRTSLTLPPEIISIVGNRKKKLKIFIDENTKNIVIHNGNKVNDFQIPNVPYDLSKFLPN